MHGLEDWEIVEFGPSFGGTELMTIKETLNSEISGYDYEGSIVKRATKISRMLKYSLGLGHWQIIFIRGHHAKKLACSRNYFVILQKRDGLKAYIWVNRFVSLPLSSTLKNNSNTR